MWPVWPEVPWVVGSGQTTINTAVHQQPVKLVIPSLDGPARQAVVKAVRGSARTTILPRRAHRARALIFELPPLAQKLYDIVHNQFVKLTSSMNMAIMGNTKLALLIVLSTLTLETDAPITPLRVVGIGVAFVGVVWYTWFKLDEQARAKREPDDEEKQAELRRRGEASSLIRK